MKWRWFDALPCFALIIRVRASCTASIKRMKPFSCKGFSMFGVRKTGVVWRTVFLCSHHQITIFFHFRNRKNEIISMYVFHHISLAHIILRGDLTPSPAVLSSSGPWKVPEQAYSARFFLR